MEEYVKGIYTKQIYKTEQGYLVGLFKIKETNIEELEYYVNYIISGGMNQEERIKNFQHRNFL